jgi:GDP-4-dehydro-6-deoxy-D-mannose reductase
MTGMRVLVIGAFGFVGRYIGDALHHVCGADTTVVRASRAPPADPDACRLDVTDRQSIRDAIEAVRPTHVLNLAGVAVPGTANKDPGQTWRIHVDGVRHLGETLLDRRPDAVLVNAGSGLVYGASFASGRPVDERGLIDPLDDYTASKAAGDLALGVLARKGLACVRMRPLNHTGAGQSEDFVVSAFAAQIARIEAGLQAPVIKVGNLEAQRDFLDVRDVAAAYALALHHAHRLPRGVILNVASGIPRRIRDVLDALLALSRVPIAVEVDPQRMRPADIPCAIGDAGLAASSLGWIPAIPFDQTLRRVLDDWRIKVGDGRP